MPEITSNDIARIRVNTTPGTLYTIVYSRRGGVWTRWRDHQSITSVKRRIAEQRRYELDPSSIRFVIIHWAGGA